MDRDFIGKLMNVRKSNEQLDEISKERYELEVKYLKLHRSLNEAYAELYYIVQEVRDPSNRMQGQYYDDQIEYYKNVLRCQTNELNNVDIERWQGAKKCTENSILDSKVQIDHWTSEKMKNLHANKSNLEDCKYRLEKAKENVDRIQADLNNVYIEYNSINRIYQYKVDAFRQTNEHYSKTIGSVTKKDDYIIY